MCLIGFFLLVVLPFTASANRFALFMEDRDEDVVDDVVDDEVEGECSSNRPAEKRSKKVCPNQT